MYLSDISRAPGGHLPAVFLISWLLDVIYLKEMTERSNNNAKSGNI